MSLGSDLADVLAVTVHKRAAGIVNLAGHICDGEGCPLNELQVIALTHAVISSFDGISAEFESMMDVEAGLRTARWLIGPAS